MPAGVDFRPDPSLSGSALKADSQDFAIVHSTFSGNFLSTASLILYNSNITMYNSTFADNKHSEAGGISLWGTSLQIFDSVFEDNRGVQLCLLHPHQ